MDATDKTAVAATPKFKKVDMAAKAVGRSEVLTAAHWDGAPAPVRILVKVGLGNQLNYAKGVARDLGLGEIVDGPDQARRDDLDAERVKFAQAQGIAPVRVDRPDNGTEMFDAGERGLHGIGIGSLFTGAEARGYSMARAQVVRHRNRKGTLQFKLEIVLETGSQAIVPKRDEILKFLANGVNFLHVWDNCNNVENPTWTVNGVLSGEPLKGQLVFHAVGVSLRAMIPSREPQPYVHVPGPLASLQDRPGRR